jgi:hypothetical protein
MLARRGVNKKIILLSQIFHGHMTSHILTLIIGTIAIRLLLIVLSLWTTSVRIHESNHLLIILHIIVAMELCLTLKAKLIMRLSRPTYHLLGPLINSINVLEGDYILVRSWNTLPVLVLAHALMSILEIVPIIHVGILVARVRLATYKSVKAVLILLRLRSTHFFIYE